MRLRAGFMPAPHYFPTFSVAVVLCVRVPDVPVNVSMDVPLDAPLGTAKSTVTLAVSDPDVSVTDDRMTVQVEFGGPPVQVRLMVPWNPVVDFAEPLCSCSPLTGFPAEKKGSCPQPGGLGQ